MKKIGVISDTHLRYGSEESAWLQELNEHCFSDVDMIIHAGDMVDVDILLAFAPTPVYAVRGNMDSAEDGHPVKRIIDVEDVRIGLMHGWGHPSDLEKRLKNEFFNDEIDCLVYGHSHYPANHQQDGILFFNPGSPIDRRNAPYHSVGILEVEGTAITGSIIRLD